MDKASFFGLLIGVAAILLGHVLEGGHVGSIIQGTAAVIVFGGTFGAVLISNTGADISRSFQLLKSAFASELDNRERLISEIVESAQLARKESILSLEKKIPTYSDGFLRNVVRFMVDGVEPATIKEIFENEIAVEEKRNISAAKVFTDAGGFAPTIGIIGAVLGLIHVMENLTDTSKLGSGIAVAFVATVYGVGSANLLFLPLANKVKKKVKDRSDTKEMILTGVLSIVQGLNPVIIEEKLKPYLEKA